MWFIFMDETELTMIPKENENIEDVNHRQQQGTSCWEKHLKRQVDHWANQNIIDTEFIFVLKEGKWRNCITAKLECKNIRQ